MRGLINLEELFEYGKINSKIANNIGAKEFKIKRGEVAFKKVSFGYDEKRKIFEDFNLKIPAWKKVALVGHSGSGKTTLIKLLYRFYDVQD